MIFGAQPRVAVPQVAQALLPKLSVSLKKCGNGAAFPQGNRRSRWLYPIARALIWTSQTFCSLYFSVIFLDKLIEVVYTGGL